MKIVFLQDDFPPVSFGGAGISTYELAVGMKLAGHDVSVITTCRKKEDAGVREYGGITVRTIASNYNLRFRAYVSIINIPVIRELAHILEEQKPDVVHINNVHCYLSYYAFKVARRYAKVVVFTARDVMSFNFGKLATKQYLDRLEYRTSIFDQMKQSRKRWNPFLYFFVRHFLSYADRVCAISNALKDALHVHGIPNVTVVYNGIEVDDWNVSEKVIVDFKIKHGLQGKKILLFSGRLNESKGGSMLIRALPDIIQVKPDTVLLVAGNVDEYAERMKREAEQLGVQDNIIFTNWINREEIKVAYGASDIVLMPSVCFDAFGRVNVEAMVSRKPVISTHYGGSPEVVKDGVTGYIIDPREPKNIAEKVIILLQDPEKAKQFGEAGYRRAKEKFNLNSIVGQYETLYTEIISSKKNIF